MNIKNIVALIALTSSIAHAANDYVILKNPNNFPVAFKYGENTIWNRIEPGTSTRLNLDINLPLHKANIFYKPAMKMDMLGYVKLGPWIVQAAKSENKEIDLKINLK